MRKCLLAVLLITILVSFTSLSFAQNKITTDPNTVVTPTEAKDSEKPDLRLAQEITYDSGYKRLHTVIDDICQLSGVNIQSGRNKDDWRVRDIPVVVYVKDMPLGKLLKVIAEATHTRFVSEKIKKDNPTKKYRIFRTLSDDAAIDDYLNSQKKARIAQVKWEWDAIVAYGKSNALPGVPLSAWFAAKLADSFGPGAWDRLLKGETLRLTVKDSAAEQLIKDLYQETRNEEIAKGRTDARTPTTEDIEYAVFKTKFRDDFSAGLDMNFGPVRMEQRGFAFQRNLVDVYLLKKNGLKLPPNPEMPKPPDRAEEMRYTGTVRLMMYDKEWNRPLLTAKFDLEKPKDIKDPTFADLIRAIAQASGCNIVTEDFSTHRGAKTSWDTPILPEDIFKKGTSISDTLKYKKIRNNGNLGIVWFFNESDKLMIGLKSGWLEAHRNLVPESFVNRLRENYKTTGIELDDAIHAIYLPGLSFSDWILAYEDLRFLEKACYGKNAMWLLYDALAPADKLQTQSIDGLSLAKFDKGWVTSFFIDQNKRQYLQPESPTFPEESSTEVIESWNRAMQKYMDFNERAAFDPAIISTMVIHLKKLPAKYRYTPNRGNESIPPQMKLSSYNLVIDYKMDGEKKEIEIGGPCLAFPVMSPEREAEIIKAAKEK
ncbi:MAG: hypothetical protein NT018_04220 [Armatimonadetes bacterium]|nr:hypothetical protein [Armatimonadota bacterium]